MAINGTPDGEQPKKRLNFYKALANGASLGDIREAENNESAPVYLPTFDEFSGYFEEREDVTPELLQQNYKSVADLYDHYTINKQHYNDVTFHTFPDNEYFKDKPQYPKRSQPVIPPTIDVSRFFTTPSGGMIELFSADKEASLRGVYLDKEGEVLPLALSEYAKNPLKRMTTPTGHAYWQEAQDDEFIAPNQIRNAFGKDRDLQTSNIWSSMLRGFWSGSVPMIAKGTGAAIGFLDSIYNEVMNEGMEYDPKKTTGYKWNKEIQNWANSVSTKNYDEMSSMLDDWNSGIYAVTNGMAQLLGIIGSGFVLGGVTRLAAISPMWANRIAFQGTLLLGDFEAGAAVQDIMLEHGMSYQETQRWLVPYMVATHLSEMTFGGLAERAGIRVANKYMRRGPTYDEAAQIIKHETGHVMNVLKKSPKDLTDAEKKLLYGNIWRKLNTRRKQFIEFAEGGSGFSGAARRVSLASVAEGFEELEEAKMHQWLNMLVNGREMIVGEKYLQLNKDYDYQPIDPENPAKGYIRRNKYNYDDASRITEAEYQRHIRKQEHYNAVLSGEKQLPEDYNWEEGLAATLSTLLTFGIGNAITVNGSPLLGPSNKQEQTHWEIGYAIAKKPEVRGQILKIFNDMAKDGQFNFTGLTGEEAVNALMSSIDLTVAAIKNISDDPTKYKAIRGDKMLLREAVETKRELDLTEENISELKALSEEIGGGKTQEANSKLGLKEGSTAEDIATRITELEEHQKEQKEILDDILLPARATEISFDENGRMVRNKTNRVKTYTDLNGNQKQAERSLRYHQVFYDIFVAKLPNGIKFSNVNGKSIHEVVQDFIDSYQEALNRVINTKNTKKTEAVPSEEKLGAIVNLNVGALQASISNMKAELEAALKEDPNVFSDLQKVQGLLGSMIELTKPLQAIENIAGYIEPGSEVAGAVTKGMRGMKTLMKQFGKTDNPAVAQQIDLLNSLMESVPRTTEEPVNLQLEDYNNPTEESKIDALKTIAGQAFSAKLADLYESATKEGQEFVDDFEDIAKMLTFYEVALQNAKYYVDANRETQKKLERSNETIEYSPLIESPNARVNENMEKEFNAFYDDELSKIQKVRTEVSRSSINRKTSNFRSKAQFFNIELLMFNDILKLQREFELSLPKDVEEAIRVANQRLGDIFKQKLTNQEEVESLNKLLGLYINAEEEFQKEIDEVIHKIEAELIRLKEGLSGKLLSVIEFVNKKAKDIYFKQDPLDTNISIDRKTTNLEDNDGFFNNKTWVAGFGEVFNLPSDELIGEAGIFYYQFMINSLIEMQNAGNNGSPTYSHIINELRHVTNSMSDIDNVQSYEQERLITSLLLFQFNSKNDLYKLGIKPLKEGNSVKDIVDNVIFAKGYSGAGKTTLVTNRFLRALHGLMGNRKLKVKMIVPTDYLKGLQKERNMADLIEDGIISLELLYTDQITDPNLVNGKETDVVLVDEATIIPKSLREQVITTINNSESNWIFIGDDAQTTPFREMDGTFVTGEYYLVNTLGRSTLPITEVFRTSASQFQTIADMAREGRRNVDKIYEIFDRKARWKISEDGKRHIGLKWADNTNEVVNDFVDYVDQFDPDAKRTILIVLKQADKDAILAEAGKDSRIYNLRNNIKTIEYDFPQLLKESGDKSVRNNLVSGMEVQGVFTAIDFLNHPDFTEGNNGISAVARSILVGLTRQAEYLVTVGKSENNVPLKKNESDLEILPKGIGTPDISMRRRYLLGFDEDGQHVKGRYEKIVTTNERFNPAAQETKESVKSDETIKDYDLSSESITDIKASKAVNDFINTARKGKQKETRASDIAWMDVFGDEYMTDEEMLAVINSEEATDQEKTDAVNRYVNKRWGQIGNLAVNYAIRDIITKNRSDKVLTGLEGAAIKAINEINKIIDASQVINSPKEFFHAVANSFSIQPDVAFELSTGLHVAAPHLSFEGTEVSSQPNLVTIIGVTADNRPIVNIHNYRTKQATDAQGNEVKSEFTKAHKLQVGLQAAMLVSMGAKINKVVEHNFDLELSPDERRTIYISTEEVRGEQLGNMIEQAMELVPEATAPKTKAEYVEEHFPTEEDLGRHERLIPSIGNFHSGRRVHKRRKDGGLYKTGKLITQITVSRENGKLKHTIYFGKEHDSYENVQKEFVSEVEAPEAPSLKKKTSDKYVKNPDKPLWGTSMGFRITNAKLGQALVPMQDFFDVSKNKLLVLRNAILNSLGNVTYTLTLHNSYKGIEVQRDGTVTSMNKEFAVPEQGKYPITIDFYGERIFEVLLKNKEVKQALVEVFNSLADDVKADINVKSVDSTDDMVLLMKELGMRSIGIMSNVEYEYGEGTDKLIPPSIMGLVNDFINSPTLTPDEVRDRLDKIFDDNNKKVRAFIGDEAHLIDQGLNPAVIRQNLIEMNKARLELIRILKNAKEPIKFKGVEVTNGNAIIKVFQGKPNRKYDISDVEKNAKKYGFHLVRNEDGSIKLFYEKGLYASGGAVYAKAFRTTESDYVPIFFHGKETEKSDLNTFYDELNQLKNEQSLTNDLKKIEAAKLDKTADQYSELIENRLLYIDESAEIFAWVSNNSKTLMSMMAENPQLAKWISVEVKGRSQGDEIEGKRVEIRGSVVDKIKKAKYFLDYLSDNWEEIREKYTFYRPPIRQQNKNSISAFVESNMVTAFETVSQPQTYVPFNTIQENSTNIPLNKYYNGERLRLWKESTVKSYLRGVMGSYADSKVFMNPGLIEEGSMKKWGDIQNAMIRLAEIDGKIAMVSARHEAIHFIMIHLVEPGKANQIYSAAEKELISRGYKIKTDWYERFVQLNEHIADRYEGRIHTGIKLLDRFINWLRKVVNRFTKNELNTFFNEVDQGVYRNASFHSTDFNYVLNKEMENRFNTEEAFEQLVEAYGSLENADRFGNTVLMRLWLENSPYGRNLKLTTKSWKETLGNVMGIVNSWGNEYGQKKVVIHDHQGKKIRDKTVAEMTKADYTTAIINRKADSPNSRAVYLYERFHAAQGINALIMLQRSLPDMNIETLRDTEQDAIEHVEFFDRDNNLYNPFDSKSNFFRHLFGTIPLYTLNRKEPSKFPIGFVNYRVMDSILIQAYMNLRLLDREPTLENVIDLFKKMIGFKEVGIEQKKSNVLTADAEVANSIYSFLREYGTLENNPVVDDLGNITGISMMNIIDVDPILATEEWANENISLTEDEIEEKQKRIRELLNTIDSYYKSLKHNILSYVDATGQIMSEVRLHDINKSIAKTALNGTSDLHIFTPEGNMAEGIKDKITGERPLYKIDKDTISIDEAGTYRVILDKNVLEDTEKSKTLQIDDARRMFYFMGFPAITMNLLNSIKENGEWADVVNNLHNMMYTLYTASLLEDDITAATSKRIDRNFSQNYVLPESIDNAEEVQRLAADIFDSLIESRQTIAISSADSMIEDDMMSGITTYIIRELTEQESKIAQFKRKYKKLPDNLKYIKSTIDDLKKLVKSKGFETHDEENISDAERTFSFLHRALDYLSENGSFDPLSFKESLFDENLKRKHVIIDDLKFSKETNDAINYINGVYRKEYNGQNLVDKKSLISYYVYNNNILSRILPTPSKFYNFTEDVLGKNVSMEIENLASRMQRKSSGAMAYAHPLSSYLFDLFQQKFDATEALRSKIKGKLSNLESSNKKAFSSHEFINNKNESYRTEMPFNNAILNERFEIDFIKIFDGVKAVNQGRDFDELTGFDLIKTLIEGYIIPKARSREGFTKTPTFSDTMSDKSTLPMFEVVSKGQLGKSLITYISPGRGNNKITDLQLNKSHLIDIIFDIGRFYESFKKNHPEIAEKLKDNEYIKAAGLIRKAQATGKHNPELLYEKIQEVFQPRFNKLLSVAESVGYELPRTLRNSYTNSDNEEVSGDIMQTRASMGDTNEWNPIFELAFWLHAVINESVSQLVRGPSVIYGETTDSIYKTNLDYLKRAAGPIAPGGNYAIGNRSTLQENSNVIVLEDPLMTYNLFGKQETEAKDGTSWILPWYHSDLIMASGGHLGSLGSGPIKNVNFNYDPIDAKITYLKFAQFPIPETQSHAPFFKSLIKMALGEVGNIEYFGKTWAQRFDDDFAGTKDAFWNWLNKDENKANKSKLVDYVVFKTAYKRGATKVHSIGTNFKKDYIDSGVIDPALNSPENYEVISNRTLRHQTVTHQDTIDPMAPVPTQLLFIMGGLPHNHQRLRKINDALTKIADEGVNELIKENENPESYMREMGRKYALNRGYGSKYHDLVKDAGISIDLFRDNMISGMMSQLERASHPSMPGQNMIQAPSLAKYWFYNGMAYLPSEATDEIRKNGIERELRSISYDKDGKFSPAEIVAPFAQRVKFGITDDMTLAQAMTISDGTKSINMNGLSDSDIKLELSKFKIDRVKDNMSQAQQEVLDKLEAEGLTRVEALYRYFRTFNKALDVIAVRIPSTNASSGFAARIVAFEHGTANTIYTSPLKNIIDGSDYDIDALRMFFRNVSDFLTIPSSKTKGAQNTIFDSIWGYYHDSKNREMITQPIDYDTIEKAADARMENTDYWTSDLGSMIESFMFSMTGKRIVGHFASLENYMFRAWALPQKTRERIFPGAKAVLNDDTIPQTTGLIAKLINAATDNEKLGGALGRLNINEYTSQLVNGMIYYGYTEKEIIEALDSEDVIDAYKAVSKSRSLLRNYTGGSNSNFQSSANMFEKLNDPDLVKAAYAGEALRRLGDIISLIQGLPNNMYDLRAKINQIEFDTGMTIEDFLFKKRPIKSAEDQISFINNSGKYRKIKNDTHELGIRNALNFTDFFIQPEMSHFKSIVKLLYHAKQITNVFTMAEGNRFENKLFELTGIKNYERDEQYRMFANEFDNHLIGLFISQKRQNIKVELRDPTDESVRLEEYDLSTDDGRFRFVSEFPMVVGRLKNHEDISVRSNPFVKRLGIRAPYDLEDFNVVEFKNSIYIDRGENGIYSDAFRDLSIRNFEVHRAFQTYQLLLHGFKYRNGSFVEVIGEENEIEYSQWLEAFINSLDEPAVDQMVRNIIVVGKNAVASARLVKGAINDKSFKEGAEYGNFNSNRLEDGHIVRRYPGSNDAKYEYVNGLSSRIYNTYREGNMETTRRLFKYISQAKIRKLNDPNSKTPGVVEYSTMIPNRINYLSNYRRLQDDFSSKIFSGDVVMLPNGQSAVVETANDYKVKIKTAKKQARVTRENSKAAMDVVMPIIEALQKSFPNIKIHVVNEDSGISNDGSLAWFDKGELYLNADRMQVDIPVHEFIGHILIDLLEITNPTVYNSLKAEAIDLLNSADGIKIKEEYSGKSRSDLIKEMIANMIGWTTEDKVLDYLLRIRAENAKPKSKSLWSKIQSMIDDIWNWIMGKVSKYLGVRMNMDNISTASIRDLASSALEAVMNGQVISYITSDQYYKLWNTANWEARIVKDGIKNISDLESSLSIAALSEGERIAQIKHTLRNNDNTLEDYYTGRTERINPNDDETIRRVIRAQDERAAKFNDAMLDILNSDKDWKTKASEVQGTHEYFGYDELRGTYNYSPNSWEHFLRQIKNDNVTKYYKYSDLKDHKELSHLYNESLHSKTFNPIIAVQMIRKDQVVISMYDVTNRLVTSTGKARNILSPVIDQKVAKLRGISLLDDNMGTHKLMLYVLYSNMAKKDSNLKIENVAFIQFLPSSSIPHFIDPADMLKNAEGLGKEQEFKEAIANPDIRESFEHPYAKPDVDYWRMLESFYEENPPRKFMHSIRGMFANENGRIDDQYRILSNRLKFLIAGRDLQSSQYTPHELSEIRYIMGLMKQLHTIGRNHWQLNRMNTMNGFDVKVFDANSVGEETVQELRSVLLKSSGKVAKKMEEGKKEMDALYKEAFSIWNENNFGGMQYLKNVSRDVWDALFAKIEDEDGNQIETGYIYWTKDENQVESLIGKRIARQAKKHNIDDRLLAIGRKITDIIENNVRQAIYHDLLNSGVSSKYWNYEESRDITFEEVDWEKQMHYERGMVPLMPRTPGEYFSTGKWSDMKLGIGKGVRLATDLFDYFDLSNVKNEGLNNDMNKLDDMFYQQFVKRKGSKFSMFGNATRTYLLGLTVELDKDGNERIKLEDRGKNRGVSKNMNLVMDSHLLTRLRREEMENHVLPMFNGAMLLYEDLQYNHVEGQEVKEKIGNVMKYLELYKLQAIEGKRKKSDAGLPGGLAKFDPIALTTIKVATPAVMALNMNIGLIGLLSNTLFGFMEGVANNITKNQLFTVGDLSKASAIVLAKAGLVKGLMKYYQVMNMTEYDLLKHQTRRVEQKNIFTEFASNAVNWSADYYSRAVIMVAQMLREGSFDAHSLDEEGNIVYDAKKDKRLYSADGKQDKKQAYLEEFIKGKLIEEGVWNQDKDKALVSGYTLDSMRKFKALGDKIVGAYDNIQKSVMGSETLGRLFGMFKTWFTTRYTNAFMPNQELKEYGDWVIDEDDNGDLYARFERLQVEGYLRTMVTLSSAIFSGNYREFEWTDLRKANVAKWGLSITLWLVGTTLYSLLVGDPEKWKRKMEEEQANGELTEAKKAYYEFRMRTKVLPDLRLLRNIKYGLSSLMILSTMIEFAIHPIAAWEIIAGWVSDPMGRLSVGNLPGKTQIKTFTELYDFLEEEESYNY